MESMAGEVGSPELTDWAHLGLAAALAAAGFTIFCNRGCWADAGQIAMDHSPRV